MRNCYSKCYCWLQKNQQNTFVVFSTVFLFTLYLQASSKGKLFPLNPRIHTSQFSKFKIHNSKILQKATPEYKNDQQCVTLVKKYHCLTVLTSQTTKFWHTSPLEGSQLGRCHPCGGLWEWGTVVLYSRSIQGNTNFSFRCLFSFLPGQCWLKISLFCRF